MIGKKMWALCKKRKFIGIYLIGAQKFISDGSVFADITARAPKWDIKDVASAADISPNDLEGYKQIVHKVEEFESDEILTIGENDKQLVKLDYTLNMDGDERQPFVVDYSYDKRLVCVDKKLLDVFKDTPLKTYTLGTLADKPAVYIWLDSICTGIILPLTLDLSAIQDYARVLATAASVSLEQNFLDSGGQMKLPDA